MLLLKNLLFPFERLTRLSYVVLIVTISIFGFVKIEKIYGAEHRFALVTEDKSARQNFTDYTVLIKNTDLVFSADTKGNLISPLQPDKKTFFLKNGTYIVSIIGGRRNETITQTLKIDDNSPIKIIFRLKSSRSSNTLPQGGAIKKLDRVEIKSFSKKKKDPSLSVLSAYETRFIPGAGSDVIRNMVNLPGVAYTSSVTPSLYIRGMSRYDILFAYDSLRVGKPFHILGFYSAFPANSIDSLNFYPGTFSAEYGNSQGSVVNIHSKKSHADKVINGEIDINISVAGAQLNIPINDSLYLSIGGRRTYYEGYLAVLEQLEGLSFAEGIIDTFNITPYFYDVNFKFDWKINPQNSLYVIGVASGDKLSLEIRKPTSNETNKTIDFTDDWDVQGFVYEYKNNSLINTTTLYRFYNQSDFNIANAALGWQSFVNNTEDYTIANQVELSLTSFLSLLMELRYTYQSFPFTRVDYNNSLSKQEELLSPEDKFRVLANKNNSSDKVISQRHVLEEYNEASFEWKDIEGRAGINFIWNDVNNAWHIDPRASILHRFLDDKLKVYIKGGIYTQLPRLQFINSTYGVPDLQSSVAYQYAIGSKSKFLGFNISIEGYYNDLKQQIIDNPTYDKQYPNVNYKENPRYLNEVDGATFGVELLIRRQIIRGIFGWLSYSYGRSSRLDYPFYDPIKISNDPKNNGLTFQDLDQDKIWQPYNYEREHILNLILVFPLIPRTLMAGLRTSFVTGYPYSTQVVGYEDLNSNGRRDATESLRYQVENKDQINNANLPSKYTIDFRIEYLIKLSKTSELAFYLDLWNVQYLWSKTVNNYLFDRGFINPDSDKYNKDLSPGDAAPIIIVYDFPILPIIGFKYTF